MTEQKIISMTIDQHEHEALHQTAEHWLDVAAGRRPAETPCTLNIPCCRLAMTRSKKGTYPCLNCVVRNALEQTHPYPVNGCMVMYDAFVKAMRAAGRDPHMHHVPADESADEAANAAMEIADTIREIIRAATVVPVEDGDQDEETVTLPGPGDTVEIQSCCDNYLPSSPLPDTGEEGQEILVVSREMQYMATWTNGAWHVEIDGKTWVIASDYAKACEGERQERKRANNAMANEAKHRQRNAELARELSKLHAQSRLTIKRLMDKIERLEKQAANKADDGRDRDQIVRDAIAERDAALAERDAALAERDAALAERDEAIAAFAKKNRAANVQHGQAERLRAEMEREHQRAKALKKDLSTTLRAWTDRGNELCIVQRDMRRLQEELGESKEQCRRLEETIEQIIDAAAERYGGLEDIVGDAG